MAKVLITGGAGFIGSHVADACIAAGHDTAIVDDLSSGRAEYVPAGARLHVMDIRDPGLAPVFAEERPEVVHHLAAQMDVRKSLADPGFDASVNIGGTLNVLENCVKHGVRKLIFASTGGAIYGEPAALPADEDCPARPLSHYGVSKLCAEHYIALYRRLHGLTYSVLRFANVYGPRQSPHGEAGVCAILAGMMLRGESPVLYGHGEPLRDYVYVEDIARACIAAHHGAADAVLNLGAGEGVSVRELFDHIGALTGHAGAPRLAPLRTGEVRKIYVSAARAKEALGWAASVPLEEGLRRTVDWLRAKS